MSIDYSEMKTWLSPLPVRSSAEAVAQDGAAFAEVASGAETSWRDLRAVFHTSSLTATRFYDAGGRVTDYGNSVATAASTLAKHLNEFADRLEQLESLRNELIDQAKYLNRWFANRSRAGHDVEDDAWEDKSLDRILLEDRIARACREYQEICEGLASSLKKMEDDGSDPNRVLGFFTGALRVGVFVAGFIPPVSTAAAVVGAGIAIHDAYESRSRELKEEHPELSTYEIRDSATTTAIVAGGTQVTLDVVTSVVGDYVVGAVVDLPPGATEPMSNGVSQVLSIPAGSMIDAATAPVADSLPPVEGAGGWPSDGSPYVSPGSYVNPGAAAAQMQEESAAQDRVRQTKDYDGDGYTDPAFRPGSEEVKHDGVKTATVVVTSGTMINHRR